MKERIKYFDLLRAIAILGVVSIHSTNIGYTFADTSFSFNITVLWRQIINFSVPIFIAISGYFLADKNVSTKKDYFTFLKRQVPRVLIPYLIWSILYLVIAFVKGSSISTILYRFLTFTSAVPFYFVILIIEFYILLPILQKVSSQRKGLLLSGIISTLCCIFIFYFRYFTNIHLPIYICGSAPSWLFFYSLGIYIKKNGISLSNKAIALLTVLSLGLSLLETYYVYYKFGSIGESVTAVKISSFIYSTFIILLAFKHINRNYNKTKILLNIGEVSYGIFLSHMFFLMCFNFLSNRLFPIIDQSAILKQIYLIIMTVLSSTIFANIVRKIDKEKAIKYLGQ